MKKDDKGNISFDGKVLDEKYVTEVAVPDANNVKGASNAVIGVTNYKMKIDRDALAKDPAIEAQIKTISAGILNGSKWGATDLYIDQLIPAWNAQHPDEKDKIKEPTESEKWTKVDEAQFVKLFTPFYLNHIQDYPVVSQDGKPKQTLSIISPPTSASNANKPNAAEAKRQYGLKRIADVEATGSGDIIGTKGFVKLVNGKYKMYKWKGANQTTLDPGAYEAIPAGDDIRPEQMYDLMGVFSVPVGKLPPKKNKKAVTKPAPPVKKQ